MKKLLLFAFVLLLSIPVYAKSEFQAFLQIAPGMSLSQAEIGRPWVQFHHAYEFHAGIATDKQFHASVFFVHERTEPSAVRGSVIRRGIVANGFGVNLGANFCEWILDVSFCGKLASYYHIPQYFMEFTATLMPGFRQDLGELGTWALVAPISCTIRTDYISWAVGIGARIGLETRKGDAL